MDEHLNFEHATSVLAESASRALGGVIAKTKQLGDLGYATFSKLFHTCLPHYGLHGRGMGLKVNVTGQMVQNRAIRYFLGVHKFAPVLAVTGDMGCELCEIRWKGSMLALWNRLMKMPESRVDRKIFSWDATIKGAWASEVEDTFMRIGASDIFQNVSTVHIPLVKEALFNAHQIRWSQDILCKPKLRTLSMINKSVIAVKSMFVLLYPKDKDHHVPGSALGSCPCTLRQDVFGGRRRRANLYLL